MSVLASIHSDIVGLKVAVIVLGAAVLWLIWCVSVLWDRK